MILYLIVTCCCLVISYLDFKKVKAVTKDIDNLKVEFAIVYLVSVLPISNILLLAFYIFEFIYSKISEN